MNLESMLNTLFEGALIGLAASLILFSNGRIMSISGIVGNLLLPQKGDIGWHVFFLIGVLSGGGILILLQVPMLQTPVDRTLLSVVVGGFSWV